MFSNLRMFQPELTYIHSKDLVVYSYIMSHIDKICMELSFNKKISYSQRVKVKEFWHFLDSETRLKPYTISSDKIGIEEQNNDEPSKLTKTMWQDQLKLFQEHGLDKAALSATQTCKLCNIRTIDKSSELADMVEQPYEELLNDMKIYEEKLSNKTGNCNLLKH